MSVCALEKDRMIGSDFIDVPTRGKFLTVPQGFVPAEASNPFCGSGSRQPLANALAEFFDGASTGQVDCEFFETSLDQMHVSIVESLHDEASLQVDNVCGRPLEFENVAFSPYRHNAVAAHSHRLSAEHFAK